MARDRPAHARRGQDHRPLAAGDCEQVPVQRGQYVDMALAKNLQHPRHFRFGQSRIFQVGGHVVRDLRRLPPAAHGDGVAGIPGHAHLHLAPLAIILVVSQPAGLLGLDRVRPGCVDPATLQSRRDRQIHGRVVCAQLVLDDRLTGGDPVHRLDQVRWHPRLRRRYRDVVDQDGLGGDGPYEGRRHRRPAHDVCDPRLDGIIPGEPR